MPLPLIFTSIAGGFAIFLSRKVATATATIAGAALLTAVFIACINQLLQSLLALLAIPLWLLVPLGMFMPGNFALILSIIASSRICRAAYEFAIIKIKMINTAT